MKNKKLPIVIAFLGFVSANLAFAQSHNKAVKDYLETTPLLSKDVKNRNFIIASEDPSQSLNGTVVHIRQSYDGIPVFGNEATLLVRDEKVMNFAGNFSKNSAKVAGKSNAADASTILVKVAQNLKFSDPQSYAVALVEGNMRQPELVYFDNGNDLVLSYELEFEDKDSHNLWMIIADAKTGEVYSQQSLTVSCDFVNEPYKGDADHTKHFEVFPQQGTENPLTPKLVDNASYRVYAFPVEAPSFGDRTLVTNPWDLTASPEGWHSDGTTSYTISRGNNVYTYTDMDNLDTPQFTVDGGSSRNFDFPLDLSYWPTGSPGTGYTDAALTNLFYVNNRVHDILYKFGFTETAKNFQANNFGKGGAGNDYVKAEARDGSGTNNANFSTPSDGNNGKMQMYIWYPNVTTLPQVFFINTPSEYNDKVINVGRGYFGSPLSTTPLTADVVIPNVPDGCTAITAGSLTGKIAYIKRGDCNFVVKVRNAQDAGAVAAIIANNKAEDTDTQVSNMIGSTDPGVVIPSVFINKLDAAFFDGLFADGKTVNITLKEADLVPRDANLDNGVIAHEYGHGLSTRTTGSSVGCLSSTADKEQMGEGWSDFLALMFTMKPTDNASIPRGIGTYLSFQPTTGGGIRPAKYSPDFAINDYTYGDTNGMEYTNTNGQLVPDVHSIGFVWASILWDLHWKYVAEYGFNNDLTADANSGSAKAFQTVLNGIKLQGCFPTFVMGRDGILAADQAMTGGENKCLIWNVFAKRGVGLNASAGSKTNINDQTEDFEVPAECALATSETVANQAISIYPNPAKNEFFLNIKGNVLGKVNVDIFDASGRLVSSQKVDVSGKEAITTQNLQNGVYIVKASGLGFEYSSKLIVKK